ncbi:hypothetical protein HXX76_001980 [Chlamydomonas incerta]|uniref:Serine aminopeptidase S33 domain-containing protein n=1 Tax=Chlamydomonas incerta TaxID=51695 RepID=A0A836AZX8_CHLIN|nr:hypothetical protein HXX76_001980 [Chlamydomonas incerta]|eukprot:KAG2443630.1 hypothetical protein HXX76_001980 [Chlamydomonas incerta]
MKWREEIELWDADPACFKHGTRVRNALEYLRACQTLCAELHCLDFPFLVFHSARDKWTDANGSWALYERSRSADKTLVPVDHMFHVLTKEDGWRDVLATALAWLDAHTAAAAAEGQVEGKEGEEGEEGEEGKEEETAAAE